MNNGANWAKRRDITLTIIGWCVIGWIVLSLIGRFGHTILLITLAALLAYILVPVAAFFARFLPRAVAILLAYLLVLAVLVFVLYFIVNTAVAQIIAVGPTIRDLFTPTGSDSVSPIVRFATGFGITQQQIDQAGQQIAAQAQRLTSSLLPVLRGTFNSILDFVLVIILSIYLLIDGARPVRWLRSNLPLSLHAPMSFLLDTLQRIVGGYVRGQLVLSTIIALLVGGGMYLFRVPDAVLLGLLAFIFSFIPILGTFVSGAACILLALTQGWLIAVFVLAYFVLMHVIEGDILGPRIVGKALGLHPIISILAVITGSELFGIKGALFASPVTGFVLALAAAAWTSWKETHPHEFARQEQVVVVKAEEVAADT